MSRFNHRKMLKVDFIFSVFWSVCDEFKYMMRKEKKEIGKKMVQASEINEKSIYGNNIPK